MTIHRKPSKPVAIGNLAIGGNNPIAIQSMCNTKTENVAATVAQIQALTRAGCEIIRVAVPTMAAAEAIRDIQKNITIPLVADIHFDYQLALKAMENGVDKLRINPGNIGETWKVQEVVRCATDLGVPIRIGVNGGSLEKQLLEKYHGPTPEAMVESAVSHIRILEDLNFENIVVSLKASSVPRTIDVYRLFSERYAYPLHLGVTEAGLTLTSAVKSGVALGVLLTEGIGDTIRISVTGDPLEEIRIAKDLLSALDLYEKQTGHSELIACPTCGRTEIDLIGMAREVESRLNKLCLDRNLKVAVMGCVVNGPGEGREADIGIAGGKGKCVIFKKGQVIKTVLESEAVDTLMEEIMRL